MKIVIFVSLLVISSVCVLLLFSSPDTLDSICSGSAKCFSGTVENIVDGDTIEVDGETIRLSLINTPEKVEYDYSGSKEFLESICPVGSDVVVDEDDMQISRSHRRIIAVVYCGDGMINLNEELLVSGHAYILVDFCSSSEFSDDEWAIQYGCA